MSGLTIEDPIKLNDVLHAQNFTPGDTLLLMPGRYTGNWVVPAPLSGTSEAPITMKPQVANTVIIDGTLTVNATYFEIYDIDFTDSRTDRTIQNNGVYFASVGAGLFGCIVSDLRSSGINWFGSGVGNVCENVVLNNGLRVDGAGHGHGLYSHNHIGGARLIARNCFFDQIGDYAMQLYSGGGNYIRDFTLEDNIFYGDPVHTGGGLGLIDYIHQRNIHYGDYAQLGRYGFTHQNQNGQILNNVFIGLESYTVNADCDYEWLNLTESGNTVYGGQPANRAGYTVEAAPATWYRVNAFSKSARWLASVAIYNKNSAGTVAVDFAGFDNGDYRLMNAQNPDETWDFTYAGSAIDVPTNWTARQRIGDSVPSTTWPVFGALILENQ